MKKHLVTVLKICLAIALVWWLVSSGKINFTALADLLRPELFVLCLVLALGTSVLTSLRWQGLVAEAGGNTTFFEFYRLTLIGYFFNFAMPGGVGGDVIKAYYFYKDHPEHKRVSIASVFMDRVVGLYAMLIMALIAMLIDWSHVQNVKILYSIFWLILALCIGFTFALSLLRSQRLQKSGQLESFLLKLPLGEKLNKLYQAAYLVLHGPRALAKSISYSFASQSVSIFLLYVVGSSLGSNDLSIGTYFIVAPIGFIATAIPISPAGVGVGQAAFLLLFKSYGTTNDQLGPTAFTALQAFNFLVGLIGAFFYLSKRSKNDKIPESLEA